MVLLLFSYFIVGLIVGSFLNVCIYRLPLGRSIVSPPSACGTCGHVLGPLDMIPVLSYIFSGGKCRYCGSAYSMRYAIVELLTGILFVLCGLQYLPSIALLLVFAFVASLVVITFIDFDYQIILDKILIFMLVCGIAYVAVYTKDYSDAFYGMLVAGSLMLIIYFLSRGGMGAGDVKLSFVLGFWLGWKAALLCLLLAFVMGGIIGTILLASGAKSRKDPIPFGPYLCLGAYLSLLYAPYMLFYYWHFFS
ncbi:MAG: prepilin peptidase [Acidaminococcaceae bacterium]|nr:prepilin peptidase [Acidaminococcaceae bacterium]